MFTRSFARATTRIASTLARHSRHARPSSSVSWVESVARAAVADAMPDGVSKPPLHARRGSHVSGMEEYLRLYQASVADPEAFWGTMAQEHLQFAEPPKEIVSGSLEEGDVSWFLGGRLNATETCLDRHLVEGRGERTAIIWEGDEPGDVVHVSYRSLYRRVCRYANMLADAGVRQGDRVVLYMPMTPEAAYAMLACARIGAIHSVVFAGFSADALRERINDAGARYVFTSDEGVRGGRTIPLKETVDEALEGCPHVERVFVHRRTGNPDIAWHTTRDVCLEDEVKRFRPACVPTLVGSEHPLFMLYTSGSTGTPKGLVHSTAGYLLHAAVSHKYVFDLREDDVYACLADVGWITGHSYIVYGPLANGATTVMFESTPVYPDASRYWDMVERHKINILYTSPTAIRALMKHGEEPLKGHDLSSLRVLGSVGEPINPAAWEWFHDVAGGGQCALVDTYWQTETGGIIATPLPGAVPMKPGSCAVPFFGMSLGVFDPETKEQLHHSPGSPIEGLLGVTEPWPGAARTIHRDHQRYMDVYFGDIPNTYFTGDSCAVDEHGFLRILGRVDDVINVSGHRLGSAEIESACVAHEACAEAAVVGVPHELKGEAVAVYITLKDEACDQIDSPDARTAFKDSIRRAVRKSIGPIASPDHIILTNALPKTRSGKIMRRVLRILLTDDADTPGVFGDLSTLAEPDSVDKLHAHVRKQRTD